MNATTTALGFEIDIDTEPSTELEQYVSLTCVSIRGDRLGNLSAPLGACAGFTPHAGFLVSEDGMAVRVIYNMPSIPVQPNEDEDGAPARQRREQDDILAGCIMRLKQRGLKVDGSAKVENSYVRVVVRLDPNPPAPELDLKFTTRQFMAGTAGAASSINVENLLDNMTVNPILHIGFKVSSDGKVFEVLYRTGTDPKHLEHCANNLAQRIGALRTNRNRQFQRSSVTNLVTPR